jgi:ubiquinol-cytochrome c reductase iron-sulfur subunit
LVGICTACACVPVFQADATIVGVPGGYICPCCAAHYDPAGRAHAGIARFNLPVPPYRQVDAARLMIGPSPHDEGYSLRVVEKL